MCTEKENLFTFLVIFVENLTHSKKRNLFSESLTCILYYHLYVYLTPRYIIIYAYDIVIYTLRLFIIFQLL